MNISPAPGPRVYAAVTQDDQEMFIVGGRSHAEGVFEDAWRFRFLDSISARIGVKFLFKKEPTEHFSGYTDGAAAFTQEEGKNYIILFGGEDETGKLYKDTYWLDPDNETLQVLDTADDGDTNDDDANDNGAIESDDSEHDSGSCGC